MCQHDRSNWFAVAIILHFFKTSQIFTPHMGYYNIIKFPTRITAKVITLKHSLINAVLLIVTEWPTLMPSLTSLTFYFPTSWAQKVNFFFSHYSCTSCQPQKECLSFFVSHIPHWHGQDSFCLPPGSATLALNKATCSYELPVSTV